MVKNLLDNAGDARDGGSIPGLGRSPAGGKPLQANHSSILPWEIPWTEETVAHMCTHAHTHTHTHAHKSIIDAQCEDIMTNKI